MIDRDPDENGWETSAEAWMRHLGDDGDFSRQFVLDRPMLERVRLAAPSNALDVGCGEGRFCRKLASLGIATCGIDPVTEMIDIARQKQPEGDYKVGFAEDLPVDNESFDLVVSYISLIDIDDAEQAIREMSRVLKPGGRILVANLSSFATSNTPFGKRICRDTGEVLRPLGYYLEEGKSWFRWNDVRVQNWHRPLSRYMQWFLSNGLTLTHFDEPEPHGGPDERLKAYRLMPYLMMMEWQKPVG